MFTGIIEEIGEILQITNSRLEIKALAVLDSTKIGDSISVNGICLTVTDLRKNSFCSDVSPETIKVTNLLNLSVGDFVNLERAMRADGRFGGHIVSGHIDGIGKFINKNKNGSFYELSFSIPLNLSKYVVQKGAVALNGISLTVANIDKEIVTVAIIPHTIENTNLKYLKNGDYVNIETDILAKHVEKFLSTGDNKTAIDCSFLQANGFM